jgi:uncharacterized membrane protein
MTQYKSIASAVGYMAAAFVAPRTFQKSLLERTPVDQGIVTGLSMALSYAVAAVLQDGIEATTDKLTKEKPNEIQSLGASAAAIGIGLAMQSVFKQKDNESMFNAGLRTFGYVLSATGAAGTTIHSLRAALEDPEAPKERNRAQIAATVVPMGVLMALMFDYARNNRTSPLKDSYIANSPAKAVGVSLAVLVVLSAVSRTEQFMASNVQKNIDKYAPPFSKNWLPIGHVVSLAALGGALMFGMSKLYKKVESSQDTIENNFSEAPINTFESGTKNSYINWQTLSVQGRRHIATRLTEAQLKNDLRERHIKEPIRIYVGIDSAETVDERVALALAEIKRTKALERKYVNIIAPTGTGYVNYVMSDAFEYLSKGDCAQITMQYSKRPSPMSLDRVDDGYIQYRMLINAIAKRVREIPENKRPKLFIFGESLGAWVSQDAFLHSGTDGLIASGIDRALWIGTPELSKWSDNVKVGDKLNVDKSLVGIYDNISDLLKEPVLKQRSLRYVMCTHYNDPVAHFSGSLLIQSPSWLQKKYIRPSTVPKSTKFRVPTTFVQTLIDMKNALQPNPGVFTSRGHDYRADLLDFMNIVYGFNLPQTKIAKIHNLLLQNDKNRGGL